MPLFYSPGDSTRGFDAKHQHLPNDKINGKDFPLSIIIKKRIQLTTSWNTGLGNILAGRVAWYADQVGCVLVPVVISWGCLTWIPGSQQSCHTSWDWLSLSLRGMSSQALTLSSRAIFIAWYLRCLFLGECRQASRHFWNYRVCRLWSCAWFPPKKAMCHTCLYMGCFTNIWMSWKVQYLSQISSHTNCGQ